LPPAAQDADSDEDNDDDDDDIDSAGEDIDVDDSHDGDEEDEDGILGRAASDHQSEHRAIVNSRPLNSKGDKEMLQMQGLI
jgi:hypothetical protein